MPDHPISLLRHPAHPGDAVRRMSVDMQREAGGVRLCYELHGALSRLIIPHGDRGCRRDELWTHTCFELFCRGEDAQDYCEFNFSPSQDWAAYAFRGYRQNQLDLECRAPQIEREIKNDRLAVSILLLDLPTTYLSGQIRFGPAAIVEERDGSMSYWATEHADAKPDFHRTETFTISLD